ncbi:MarR family winged helix-turn-helix transcriptional regulator [Nonomuraea sp. NPDC050328]|uniref:MarR family winged helix-turn-helix transcriptional regulator n=1 Tax=Nonomuraea sp. NPDC050328 TaxID=3364361 RepID=UPI0037A6BCBB
MTRWLSDDEQRTWRSYLAATQLVEEALDRQLQREARMPHTYYMILVALSEAPERSMRMSELARRAQASQSRLSHAVARLEERGWIERSPCASDRRGNVAVLTETGFQALAEAAPGHVEEVRRSLFDPLSPEQVRALDEICAAIRAAHEDTGPARS